MEKCTKYHVGQRPKYTCTKAGAFAQRGSHPKYDIKLDEIEEKARQIFNIDPTKLDRNSLSDAKLLQYLGYIEVEAEKLLRNWPSSKLN